MKHIECEVAVIGAGSAGLSAFRAAKSHGRRCLLIEGGAHGTTCARVGCMPSKLLIAAAEAAHGVATAAGFGVTVDKLRIDGRAVMARVRSERDRFVGFVLDGVEHIPEEERLSGYARFIAPNRLRVGDDVEVHAERIVIATGSRPAIPEQLRSLGERVIVNDDVFAWDDLPDSVAVVGTGVIGLELGQALHRLGVRVTLFGRSDRLAQIADKAVNQSALETLGKELDLRMHTEILSARVVGQEVELQSRNAEGKMQTERFSYVLAATGRRPNLEQLGLELTGLQLNDKGVPLFDPLTMQCSDQPIFIAGDADNDKPLLHEAADEGRIAGDNAARFPDVAAGLRRLPISIAFTDPQIAAVGRTLRELQQGEYECGQVAFDNQGRSRVMRQNHGMLRLYGERGTHRLLGAEMAAPRAEHLAHLLAWACQAGLTVDQLLDMPYYHPVIEEAVRTAMRNLKENLTRQVNDIEHCADCTPGI